MNRIYFAYAGLAFSVGFCAAICFWICCATIGGAVAAPVLASGSRILDFPTDVSLGRLAILQPGFNVVNRHLLGKPFCEAGGAWLSQPVPNFYL